MKVSYSGSLPSASHLLYKREFWNRYLVLLLLIIFLFKYVLT